MKEPVEFEAVLQAGVILDEEMLRMLETVKENIPQYQHLCIDEIAHVLLKERLANEGSRFGIDTAEIREEIKKLLNKNKP